MPLLLALVAAASAGVSLPATALCVLAIAYLPECLLAWSKGWYLSPHSVTAMIVRDVMLPAIWARAWFGGAVEWRGNAMTIRTKAMTELEELA
jgi:ceramide glucosyltransferase